MGKKASSTGQKQKAAAVPCMPLAVLLLFIKLGFLVSSTCDSHMSEIVGSCW
jgi:hypothetical protein